MDKFNKTYVGRAYTKTGKEMSRLKRPEMNIFPCRPNPSNQFGSALADFDLHPDLKNGLEALGINRLSTVQTQFIETYFKHGGDVICCAETGSFGSIIVTLNTLIAQSTPIKAEKLTHIFYRFLMIISNMDIKGSSSYFRQ